MSRIKAAWRRGLRNTRNSRSRPLRLWSSSLRIRSSSFQ